MRIAAGAKTVCLVVAVATAVTLGLAAQQSRPEDSLREADSLLSRLRYEEALATYRQARSSDDARVRVRGGAGSTKILLRLGRFEDAEREAGSVLSRDPTLPSALATHGDGLWSAGLFEEAEAQYTAALQMNPNEPAALHGRARSLAALSRFPEALGVAERAVAAAPDEPEYLYTQALIHERLREYVEAADLLERFARLLPPGDETHLARWARAQQQFLRSFGRRTPMEIQSRAASYTIPMRIVNGRVLVDGSVNGRTAVEFALDTGTDLTIITPGIANRAGVPSTISVQSAGVGSMGLGYRDLQLARIEQMQIGDLRVRNVPAVVKDPALNGLPRPEGAGFSPLVLGFSMVIDYGRRQLTIARQLPSTTYAVRLPLRVHRLPIVRGTVNTKVPAGFVVDTAGDASALSGRLAQRLEVDPTVPLIAARVYGSAGPDPTAFLLPFVRLDFGSGVGSSGPSIVVLNLNAPSGLLGVNLGGIIGHDLLQRYRVTIDLVRSEIGLDPIK